MITCLQSQQGNVIMDFSVINEIFQYVSCQGCYQNTMEIYELTDYRKGLASKLELYCKNCDYFKDFTSYKKLSSEKNSIHEVNVRLTDSMCTIGKCFMAAESLCAVINLPQPPKRFQPIISF